MMILNGIMESKLSPLSDDFSKRFGTGAASTVYSSLQRLTAKGILIKEESLYKFDDPFFKKWIVLRRSE